MNVKRVVLYGFPTMALVAMTMAACDRNKVAPEIQEAAAPAGPVAAISQAQATTEVTAVLKEVARAAGARDIAALEKNYDPNAQIVDFGGITKGWSNYKTKNLSTSMAQLSSSTGDAHRVGAVDVRVEGNVAWAAFPYAITADVNGTATEIFGYGTATLRHDGTRLLIVQAQTAARQRRSYDPPL